MTKYFGNFFTKIVSSCSEWGVFYPLEEHENMYMFYEGPPKKLGRSYGGSTVLALEVRQGLLLTAKPRVSGCCLPILQKPPSQTAPSRPVPQNGQHAFEESRQPPTLLAERDAIGITCPYGHKSQSVSALLMAKGFG